MNNKQYINVKLSSFFLSSIEKNHVLHLLLDFNRLNRHGASSKDRKDEK